MVGVLVFSLLAVPATLFWARPLLHLSFASELPLYLSAEVGILFAGTLDYFAFELLMRPVRLALRSAVDEECLQRAEEAFGPARSRLELDEAVGQWLAAVSAFALLGCDRAP